MIIITDETEYQECLQNDGLIVFTTKWCAPCRRLKDCLPTISAQFPRLTVAMVDLGDNNEKWVPNIRSVPTVYRCRNGDILQTMTGFDESKLKSLCKL